MKMLITALVGLTLWPAVVTAAPSVGLYYYPWYGTFTHGHDFDDTLRDHLVPRQTPALGHYSSRNAAVIASHIDQSHRANADFWALSWWGPTSAEDATIRNCILTNPRAGELKYAIHYESAGRFGSMENPNFSNMLPDFRHLAQNYFGNPNYLRIDGKPVVFLYVTRAYFNTQASRDKVAEVRQAIHDDYGYDMYLVGDDFFTTDVVQERATLWDAITNFDAYGSVLAPYHSTDAALNKLAYYYDNAQTKAHSWGVDFIPTASPGFNDRGVREGHSAAPRYMEDAATVVEGSLFRKMLADVVVPRTDAATGDVLMINSFNEWHEDTQIEPTNIAPPTTVDDSTTHAYYTEGYQYPGYGNLYLDILCQTTAPGDANLDGRVDDADASILGAHWRMLAGASWADGDFNGDHAVNDQDAAILAAHWHEGYPTEGSVPEPTSAVLLAAGLVTLLGGRRRLGATAALAGKTLRTSAIVSAIVHHASTSAALESSTKP